MILLSAIIIEIEGMNHYYQSNPTIYRTLNASGSAFGNPTQTYYTKTAFTDRPLKDSMIVSNGYPSANNGSIPNLQRENSLKHLYDGYGAKNEQNQPQPQIISQQHQRTFSDYQMRVSGIQGDLLSK